MAHMRYMRAMANTPEVKPQELDIVHLQLKLTQKEMRYVTKAAHRAETTKQNWARMMLVAAAKTQLLAAGVKLEKE